MIHNKSVIVRDINHDIIDKGIDVVWRNTDDGMTATLISEDRSMINNQLTKLKVIQDSIKTWHTYRDLPHYPLKTVLNSDGKIEKG